MASGNRQSGAEDKRLTELRHAIRAAFPVVAFQGQITNHDRPWSPDLTADEAIHDDDMLVYEATKDRSWPEIPKHFLHEQPDGFVLLTNEALPAFLAAWLMCSLDEIDGDNNVREFIVYSFSPSHDLLPDMTPHKITRLKVLSPEQRAVIRALLAEFADRERSTFVKNLAKSGIEMIDRIG